MSRTIKILVNSNSASSNGSYMAVEHYRNFGPYDHMRRYMGKPVEADAAQRITDIDWKRYDIMHFQNPHNDNHLNMMHRCKMEGIKILVDYDDDLINLPVNNHNYLQFQAQGQNNVASKIEQMMKLADAVIVSTTALQGVHSQWSDPVVIENCWYPQKQPINTGEVNPLILWRGSQSHADDIIEYQNEVVDLMQESRGVHWCFWTDTANIASWTMDIPSLHEDPQNGKWRKLPAVPMMEYMHRLVKDIRPMLTIVPLKNYAFNHAKSNIAWLETTLAGGLVVAPKWTEWNHKGVLKYSNRPEFKQKIIDVLKGKVNIEKNRAASMAVIKEKYNLDVRNLERWEIIEKLAGN